MRNWNCAEALGPLDPLERFYLLLCFDRALEVGEEGPQAALQRLVTEASLPPEHADFLLRQGAGRLFVYRQLVQSNLKEAVRAAVPRAAARMEAVFDESMSAFLANFAPDSRALRDTTRAYLAFVDERYDAQLPPYLLELAELEACRVEVAAQAPVHRGEEELELSLERGLDFDESLRHLNFSHAVHQLPEELADRSAPEQSPVQLLVYRDAEGDVRYLAVSSLGSGIVRRLQQGDALGEAVAVAAEDAGEELSPVLLEGAAKLLADLAKRGVIRRVAPATLGSS